MKSPRYTILIANRNTGVVRRLTLARRVAFRRSVWPGGGPPPDWSRGQHAPTRSSSRSLRQANESLRLENESYRAATGELADQISSLQTALDPAGRPGRSSIPAAREALSQAAAVIRSRAVGGGSGGPATPALPSVRRSRRTARSASCSNSCSTLESRLGLGQDARSKASRRWRARRRRSGRSPAGCRRATATARIRSRRSRTSTRASTSRPTAARRSARRRTARSSRPATTATTATPCSSITASASARASGICRGSPCSRARQIKRGEVIGYVGATGRATSPHLHYEILLNGQPINPLRLLARP